MGRDASFADGITDVAGLLVGLLLAPLVEPVAVSVESLAPEGRSPTCAAPQ